MSKNGYRIFDSDMHIQEPPDLWQRYIEPAYKDRAPVGVHERVRDLRLIHPDGRAWGRSEDAPRDPDRPWGHVYKHTQELFRPYEEQGWTAKVQLGAMDEEGVDVAVLYPTRGLHVFSEHDLDPGLSGAIARAYNNWLYEFTQEDPKRLFGAAMINPFDIEEAVSETHRCVEELGFKAVFLRANVSSGHEWHDPYYEPLWSTLEELNIPLGFHESAASAVRQIGDQFGGNFMLRHAYTHAFEMMVAVGSMCGAGVLERHPNLRVAFLEGNCSWLPFLLWRLDEHFEMFGDEWAPELTVPPAEIFKRQCFVSVEPDEEPVSHVVEDFGADNLVFSTDYPHVDTKFPHAVDRLLELSVGTGDLRKILWDNCARFYGMD